MNKHIHIFILGLLTLLSFAATAQKGWKFGAFALPQYVTMRNSDETALQTTNTDDWKYAQLWGMGAGLGIGYNPVENFGMKVNVLYSHQGYRHTTKHVDPDTTRNFAYDQRYNYVTRLDYLKIPFMMGIHSNYLDNKAVFSVSAGYQLDILLGGQWYDDVLEYQAPRPDNISRYPDGIYRFFRPLHHSIVGDMGLDFKLTDELAFNLHVRGDYGPGDVENKEQTIRITQNGSTSDVRYWTVNRAPTHSINVGILTGISYNIVPIEVLRKPAPKKAAAPAKKAVEEKEVKPTPAPAPAPKEDKKKKKKKK